MTKDFVAGVAVGVFACLCVLVILEDCEVCEDLELADLEDLDLFEFDDSWMGQDFSQ